MLYLTEHKHLHKKLPQQPTPRQTKQQYQQPINQQSAIMTFLFLLTRWLECGCFIFCKVNLHITETLWLNFVELYTIQVWKWLAVLHFCWTFTNRHFAQQESMGWSWVYCLLVWLGSWSECMSSLLDKDNMVHKKEVAFSDSNWKQFLERLKPVKTTRSTV